jgi:type II secretory pathway component PulF
MPVYDYEAVDKQGKKLRGAMPALDEAGLWRKLQETGLWLMDAKAETPNASAASKSKPASRSFKLRGTRGRRELIDFCTLMTFQVRAGVTLVKSLEVACQDCKDPRFGDVLREVQSHLESGLQLHEALVLYPGVFSMHFVSVMKAGVTSSHLPEAFNDLREYLEWVERISAEVRQASLYPAIVMTVIGAFALFLFTFIIPRFAELLNKLHVHQPLLTQVVFGLGDFAKASWWVWLPLILGLVLTITVGRRFSPRIALLLDRLKLRLPVFGELNLMLSLSRFTHNLAILYRSGLPILSALNLCQQGMIGNAVIDVAVGVIEQDIKTGSTISEAMQRQTVFPAMIQRMVAVGELSGNLDQSLQNVSDYYNDVIPRRIKKIFTIMEPALMVLMIIIVGSVALAIYLPIIALMGTIR